MATLLVASEGGHLTELQIIARRLDVKECAWITFDSPQSRSLLLGQEVYYAPFAGSRDPIGTLNAGRWAHGFLRSHSFDTVVSTGASLALSVLPLAAREGAECHFFESSARTSGPSLTGRLLEPFHSIKLFTQYDRWANRRWQYHSSVFDGFRAVPLDLVPEPKRLVVTLGLHKGFGFRRAVERLVRIIPPGTEVLWQTGDTDTSGLGIVSHSNLPTPELTRAMAEADAVITHAGIGTIVSTFQSGKRPVIIPRRKEFREHVDDHQLLIADELKRRDLIVCAEAGVIEWKDVIHAASSRIISLNT
jgi:UDP-N-acetylglucosamine--N-acetylmuramyl-(pentapeptide) pyrophosphoryl-undecaprenol N-acetylglucosamine transferase